MLYIFYRAVSDLFFTGNYWPELDLNGEGCFTRDRVDVSIKRERNSFAVQRKMLITIFNAQERKIGI